MGGVDSIYVPLKTSEDEFLTNEAGSRLVIPLEVQAASSSVNRNIYVFDKDENLIHILDVEAYENDVYKRENNREWSYTFETGIENTEFLKCRGKVAIYDKENKFQFFEIQEISETYSLDSKVEVYCMHDGLRLKNMVLEDLQMKGTASAILSNILKDTPYSVGNVDQFGEDIEVDMSLTSKLSAIVDLTAIVGGEYTFRYIFNETRTKVAKKYVDLVFSLGKDNGVMFTFNSNLESITREVNTENHFTVLYGFGRQETDENDKVTRVTFADEVWSTADGKPANKPKGQIWIEDAEAVKKYGRIEGIFSDGRYTIEESLLKATWSKLQETKEPKISYSVKVKDLSDILGYEHLSIAIGDTIRVKDEDYDLVAVARVQSETYSIRENSDKNIVMGVLQDSFSGSIDRRIMSVQNASNTVSGPPPTINDGSFPDTLPELPVITAKGLFASIMLEWTYENKSYYDYELHSAQIANFTPNPSTAIFRGKASSFLHNVRPGEKHYYKIRVLNTHGNATGYSSQVIGEATKVADGTEYFENAAISDAIIGTLRLDRAWVGELNGEKINAKNLRVVDGNGDITFEVDSFGRVTVVATNFSLKVGGISNIYTKDETNSTIKDAIDDIEIGGRNMIINSCFNKDGGPWTNMDVTDGIGSRYIEEDALHGMNAVVIEANGYTEAKWTGVTSKLKADDGTLLKGQPYTLSGWAYIDDSVVNDSQLSVELKGYRSSDNAHVNWNSLYLHSYIPKGETSTPKNEWFYFENTVTREDYDWNRVYVYPWVRKNGKFKVTALKLEKGNKATSWTPAPEDTDIEFETVKESIAGIDIKADSIISSVESIEIGLNERIDNEIAEVIKKTEETQSELDEILNDDVITEFERRILSNKLDEITIQYNGVIEMVDTINAESVVISLTEYKAAYNDLLEYLIPILEASGSVSGGLIAQDFISLYYDTYSSVLYAINENTSSTLQYQSSWIEQTSTTIDTVVSDMVEVNGTITQVNKHMKFSKDGLELYGTEDGEESRFKARLSETSLDFLDSGTAVASISNQRLLITDAEIKDSMRVGNYVMTSSSNGGIVFRKI